jgi:hypothetical protein
LDDLLKPLGNYKRQYIAFLNVKGERMVWVNFFFIPIRDADGDWKHTLVHFKDGGIYFFDLLINISDRKVGELRHHSEA